MDEVKLIEAIYCSKERRGNGTEFSPIHIVEQIYNKDGSLLMEYDSAVKYTDLDLIEFMTFFNPSLPKEHIESCLIRFKDAIKNNK